MPAALVPAFRGPCGGHEELAMRALEPTVTLRVTGDQFSRERLLAVRTQDLVDRILGGNVGHSSQGTCARPFRAERSGTSPAEPARVSAAGCGSFRDG